MSGEGNDDPEFMRGFLGGLDFAERLDTDEKQEQPLLTPYAGKGSKRSLRALAGLDRGGVEPAPPRSNIGSIKGPVRKVPTAGSGYRPGTLGEIVSGRGIPLGSGVHLAPSVKSLQRSGSSPAIPGRSIRPTWRKWTVTRGLTLESSCIIRVMRLHHAKSKISTLEESPGMKPRCVRH